MMDQPAQTYQIWHDVLVDSRFSPSGEALREYLKLVEGLESPTPYHIWSFLSLIAALCGDRLALNHGPLGRERLNLGVILTGVPAVRKSTALSVMQKFAEGLDVAYGPTDTAGQRQGIMSAMMQRWQREVNDMNPSDINPTTLEALADVNTDSIVPAIPDSNGRKSSEIFFVAKELGRLISSPTRELFDFFTDGMDGETFHYQLKSQSIRIRNPLINLLGATTPTSMGTMLPKGGESHGFLSRLVFVHASHQTRSVAIPERWNEKQLQIRQQLHSLILDQLGSREEAVGMSKAAVATYEDLYAFVPATADQRLRAYNGRRAKHLLKISALLAILRGTTPIQIQASDIRLGHAILVLTEANMDRAFYGLDLGFISRCMCAITELAETSFNEQVTLKEIQAYAGHLGEKDRINSIVQSLEESGKLTKMAGTRELTWRLSQAQRELAEAKIRSMFSFGDKPLGEDEHRQASIPAPKIVKGAAE